MSCDVALTPSTQEEFCWAEYALSRSHSNTKLTKQHKQPNYSNYFVFSVHSPTYFKLLCFFLETESACLCLEPINIAASASGKIVATFLCMYLWMQDPIALKKCSACLKLTVSLSSNERTQLIFPNNEASPLSFSNTTMELFSKEAGGCFEFANQVFNV